MYRTRWITALALIPVVLTLVYLGDLFFFLLVSAAALLAMWEYYVILFAAEGAPRKGLIIWTSFLFAPLMLYFACRGEADYVLAVLVLNLVWGGLLTVARSGRGAGGTGGGEELLRQIACVVYIPGALALLSLVRSMPDGGHWVLFILVVVFAGDTGALYTGTFLGKHKLCPAVSPNKTIEGSLGGVVASVAGGFIVKLFLLREIPADACLLFCLGVNVAGQLGDLFESAAKRAAGVKDSGGLLPGHGGLLDRIDALLFASPVAFLFRLVL